MVEINLLPQQERRSNQPDGWRYGMYALLPLTAVAILIPEVLVGNQLRALHREQDSLNGDIAALTPLKQEYDSLMAQQRSLESVTGVARQLRDSKTYWTNDVAAFSAQLPRSNGVAITSLNMKSLEPTALATLQQNGIYAGKNVVREIALTGTALSQQSVVNFLKAYENSPSFGVNFQGLQRDTTASRYTFTASVGLVNTAANPGTAPGTTPAGTTPAGTTSSGTTGAAAPAPQASAPGGTNVR
ncbi:fimbrial assembly protein [Deinococcus hopiensis]|uniref:Type IV pilus assembly protein PilN n=1 Tax=Deinococcus hopiensis KR-140 TaxID=695939 RepID=A0A1W1VPT7_9DEIO|nr:fimbrial assembly protein [Deinococcus hopiensis]SMB94924.1 type IV pilus assembly protein PilN [Deinococcus hopiensis KR-140]